MPSTTPERRQRWPGHDSQAICYLQGHGFTLTPQWYWIQPTKGHKLTEKEQDAIIYLIEEWDFGGLL